jgi:hypothetical protein
LQMIDSISEITGMWRHENNWKWSADAI